MLMTLFDARYAANIPTGVLCGIFGYLDNGTPWSQADWDRFSYVPRYSVATHPTTTGADVYDFEDGACVPGDAPGIWTRERAAGREPAIYSNATGFAAAAAACQAAGVALPRYGWLADINPGEFVIGQAVSGIPVVAQQFDWGQNVDMDIADVSWLGAAQHDTGSDKLSATDCSNLYAAEVYGAQVPGLSVTRLPDDENPTRRHFDLTMV